MQRDHFTDPPPRRVGSLCVIRNSEGNPLIVGKKDRRHDEPLPWGLPGGCAEQDSDIRSECARIVKEKLGVEVSVGRLLAVHHMPEKQHSDMLSREGINFVFDAGVMPDGESFVLGESVREVRFMTNDGLPHHLASYNTARLRAAMRALDGGEVQFLYD